MALLTVLVVGDIAVQLAIPQVLRTIIDGALQDRPTGPLGTLAAIVVAAAVAHMVLAVAATRVAEEVGWRATNTLRDELAGHVLHLDLGFHKQHPPGELLERVDGDVTALSNFFSAMVVQVLGNALLILGIVVLLLRESWLVGVALAAILLVGMAAMVRLHGVAVPWWHAHRAIAAETYGHLGEQVDGTEDIAGTGAGAFMQERFADQLRRWMPLEVRGWMGWALMWATSELLRVGLLAGVFVLGARSLGAGTMTVGTVYLVLHYAEMVGHPLHQIREQMQDLQKAGAAIGRVSELRATRSALAPPGPAVLGGGPLSLVFESVDFAYDDARPAGGLELLAPLPTPAQGDARPAGGLELPPSVATPASGEAGRPGAPTPVLHGVDVSIPAGRVLGVLGRTGSGKSTLARLATRLYDPDVGRVLVGGIDAADVADLRDHVAMVTQDVQLFRASIRDNLAYFDPAIDDHRLLEAITTLGLDEWLASLPDGLDTRLGGDGVGVSAGQAQLLAFTRVFLRDPGLVVLDEASSRLDPATEAWLERAVDGLLAGRTAMVIAHRLDTLDRADDVLVMDAGRVVEFGDRRALRDDPTSRYARLLATGMEEVLT